MLAFLVERARVVVRHPFFARTEKLSDWQAIGWWERRRIAFNVIVGATGVVTCFVCLIALVLIQRATGEAAVMPDPPIIWIAMVVAYGVAANVGYTAGWIVELLARRVWGNEDDQLASIHFTLGLGVSIALTLAPAGFAIAVACFEIAFN